MIIQGLFDSVSVGQSLYLYPADFILCNVRLIFLLEFFAISINVRNFASTFRIVIELI